MAKKNTKKFSKRSKSGSERIINRIDNMSRFSRIMLNISISIAVVIAVAFPVVFLFSNGVNELEEGEVLYTPLIIVGVIWMMVYGFGWAALVGFDLDVENPWKAGKPAMWITVLGAIAAFLAVLEIMLFLLFGFFL